MTALPVDPSRNDCEVNEEPRDMPVPQVDESSDPH